MYGNQYEKQLNFEIKDGGSNLSVGQRQLVCIARAMIKKPLLLLMDEATANIDTKTDGMIQNLIHSEFGESTVLTIAHRLDTIINYDKIVVLEKGVVIEQGVPGDLLMMNNEVGKFRQIVEENGQEYRKSLLTKAKFTENGKLKYVNEMAETIKAKKYKNVVSNSYRNKIQLSYVDHELSIDDVEKGEFEVYLRK